MIISLILAKYDIYFSKFKLLLMQMLIRKFNSIDISKWHSETYIPVNFGSCSHRKSQNTIVLSHFAFCSTVMLLTSRIHVSLNRFFLLNVILNVINSLNDKVAII